MLIDRLPAFFGKAKRWEPARRELVVGSTIADIVLCARATSMPQFAAPLTVAQCVLMSLVRRRGSISVDELTATARHDQLQRNLDALEESGLVTVSRGRIAPVRPWWGTRNVIAIEAKLYKWRDALDQAVRYLAYADESYVALPEACTPRAVSELHLFEAAGVGLLSVSATNVHRVLGARRSTAHDWRREFACSRLYRTVEA